MFAGTGGVYSQDNGNLYWDNTNKKLGIGVSTPTANIEIQSGTLGGPNPRIWLHNISGGGAYPALDFSGYTSDVQVRLATPESGGYADLVIYTGGYGTLTPRMKIVGTTGLVGIGTTTPGNNLSVSGNTAIGAGYAGTAAPANGLIVQGNVGIG
ncbi:hypothetical protein EB093_09560, partial [bacterium]|nr:hypothetical protein [bacterium]